jgi:hypothetical protein
MRFISILLFLAVGASLPAQSESKSILPAAPQPVMSGQVTPIPFPTDTIDAEYARRAGVDAIRQWVGEFLARSPAPRRFAVLPLARDIDGAYFTEQVRNAFADLAGGTEYALFTRDDATWNALLNEIRRGDQFGDTMEPATIQQFGRIQGVDGIITGRLGGIYTTSAHVGSGSVQLAGEGKAIQVRVSMQAYAVETGQLLWGSECTATAVLPSEAIVLPGSKRDWIIWGGAGLLALLILWFLVSRVAAANRPR